MGLLRTTKFKNGLRSASVGLFLVVSAGGPTLASESSASATFRQYCFACHSKATAMAGINLEQLTANVSIGDHYQQWQKVIAVLDQKRMPPPKMRQPTDAERSDALGWIRTKTNEFIAKNAGDPGKVTIRRLTSGEYAYTIHDLTGLNLKFDSEFATDAVGGEGFTNFGDVQFMADANLERYLEAAKRVADHSVIGAGPLTFFDDPGKSGFELSAINRINQIYRTYGFRANSGEGGKPYGMDKYSKAYFACWQYQHRAALGEPKATLESIAIREGASVRFTQHLWTVLQEPSPNYPISEIVSKFRHLPAPSGADHQKSLAAGKAGAEDLMRATIDWPRWLLAAGEFAEGGAGDERALVINDAALETSLKHRYRFPMRTRNQKTSRVYVSITPANPESKMKPFVLWRNAKVRIRAKDRGLGPVQPLREALDEASRQKLAFGKGPNGTTLDANDFASDGSFFFDVPVAADSFGADLQMEAEVLGNPGDAVLRCVVSDSEEAAKGRPVWALLGDPNSIGFKTWKKNVLEYAALLPQNSQGEATPSDKDPIPLPYNNTYNQPERDRFHAKVKYYRTDQFLMERVLDNATRVKLDQAWDDLLASFEYHDIILNFVAEKYHLDLKDKTVADLDDAQVAALPEEPRKYVRALRDEYLAVQKAQLSARPGHLDDALRFAARAWRRPLTQAEKDKLRAFYVSATETDKLSHGKAIETLLARILISPAFLYRLEQPAMTSQVRALSDWEIASRLSYFLWSSAPDEELQSAARKGALRDPAQLQQQVKRMLADSKARRLSTEFFGQWLGFYRFDQYRGVDAKRFPEFTDDVKTAMYEEAVSFFEHIVRKDRPVHEIYDANYTFLNQPLAKHYGIKKDLKSTREVEFVDGANEFNRGGLLRLGAVLTATSAPLRTSPVKRGDWVLRRVLNTPTPPPPPDAGSIPADDKMFGGMSVKQRLEAHKRNATCASCHTRIDPLGFPFESYDSVGRWRDAYSDGKKIEDFSDLADQTRIAGIDGLLNYLKSQEPQVLKTLSSKLVGYALGRTVVASDQPLIDRMVSNGSDTLFSKLVMEIVASRQFRYRREYAGRPAQTQTSLVTPLLRNSPQEVKAQE